MGLAIANDGLSRYFEIKNTFEIKIAYNKKQFNTFINEILDEINI